MKKELTRERIEELAGKIRSGTVSSAEREEFDEWYRRQSGKEFHVPAEFAGSHAELKDRIYQHIEDRLGFNVMPGPRIALWRRIAVAASILLMLGAGSYFVLHRQQPDVAQTAPQPLPDLAPGGNKAILTLSNGKTIVLDDARQGRLAAEGVSIINKTADGRVVYDKSQGVYNTEAAAMNTMRTPRGGQYQLTLADGTKVWLNAASSITYPAAFAGKDREVSITGEVYFEVAQDAARPFRVRSGRQTVDVLGTHFNINAYENEQNIRTTLLEGAVAVAAGELRKRLRPGEQASVREGKVTVLPVDTDEVTAWKDGYFQFVDADIRTIMRQLSRWYDVDVEFDGPVTTETFTGRISRNRSISQVLKILQGSRSVHLTFEKRRIMVRL